MIIVGIHVSLDAEIVVLVRERPLAVDHSVSSILRNIALLCGCIGAVCRTLSP